MLNEALKSSSTKLASSVVLRATLAMAQLVSAIGLTAITTLTTSAPALAAGNVTGTVFHDLNANGTRDAGEPGLAGVSVTSYDGGAPISTTTDATGAYTLTVAGDQTRIEFTGLAAGFQSSPVGTNNGSSVRFVAAPSGNVDFGAFKPSEFCQDNPRLVIPCFAAGNNVSGPAANSKTIVSQPYAAQGINAGLVQTEALASQTGAVYGVAYQRSSGTAFASAYIKRIAGLGPGTGSATSDGTGTIYRFEPGAPADAVPFVDLDDLFGAATTGANPHTSFTPGGGDFDGGAYGQVGKRALGDIEIGEDDATLWAVNLQDRRLYRLPLGMTPQLTPTAPTAAQVTSSLVPDPGCVNGVARPFAIKPYNGLIYVGGVCTAELAGGTSANLQAYVFTFDPNTSTWGATPVLQFPLNYPRTCVDIFPTYPTICKPGTNGSLADWLPWRDTLDTTFPAGFDSGFVAHPQPMLTDIEFVNGDMVLGFRDRFPDQVGFQDPGPTNQPPQGFNMNALPAGDMLRASPNPGIAGAFTIEDNSQSNPAGRFGPTTGANNGQGPGNGEFFYGDSSNGVHDETALGSLAYVRGLTNVVATTVDPFRLVTGGTMQLDTNTGNRSRSFELYAPPNPNDVVFNFRKANGLGDIEALCDAAPLEIGNRLWLDVNGNGVQDAGEGPIANVQVRLTDSLGNVTIATTDANGNYLFSSAPSGNGGAGAVYGVALLPFNTYTITVDNTQAPLAALNLTTPNGDAGANGDARDSDATLVGNNAQIVLTTGQAGAHNHTYDIGFTQQLAPAIALTKYTNGADANTPTGPYISVGGTVTWTYLITNTGNVTLTNLTLVDNREGAIVCPLTELAPGATTLCTRNGIAQVGQYANSAVVTGTNALNVAQQVTATDPSHYFGLLPAIELKKYTNGEDADTLTGPLVAAGSTVTWTYIFTNTGNITLTNVTIGDDQEGQICTGITLAPGQSQTCSKNGIAAVGQYTNTGTVTGTNQLNPTQQVTDTDPSHYFGTQLPAALGNYVWVDSNYDGIQNEPAANGVNGVTVQLFNAAGDVLVGTTTTVNDANGNPGYYTFTNLAPGTYYVVFTLPSGGYIFTQPNQGSNEAADSDANTATGRTADVTLNAGDVNPDVDAGLFLPNPQIVLKKYTNGFDADTITGPALLVGSTVTWTYIVTNTGNVTLTNVTLTDDQIGAITTCPKTVLTPGETMTCTATGIATAGQYTNTGTVTGTSTINTNQNVTSSDPSHYFGTTQPVASLGNFVWVDTVRNNQQDGIESGLGGVTVTLYNSSGVAIATTQTNANGFYSFTNLLPGTYSVTFSLPPGYVFVTPGSNPTSDTDSNANPSNGTTAPVTLAAGENNPTIDAGVYQTAPAIVVKKFTNGFDADTPPGPTVEPGSVVTWTFIITNTGNVTLTNVTLTDNRIGTITCPLTILAPGQSMTCTRTGIAITGQYSNTATVVGTNQLNPAQTVTSADPSHYFGTIISQDDVQLNIVKSSVPPNGTTVTSGTRITYTLTVSNTGTTTATNVIVSDRVPTDTTYVVGSAVPALASGPQPLVWNLGTLAPNQIRSVSFSVQVNTLVIGVAITNQGSVDSNETPPINSNIIVHPYQPTAVTLTRFEVQRTGDTLQVVWTTGVEVNTFGFVVLRGTHADKSDRVQVTTEVIPAKGSNTHYVLPNAVEAGAVNTRYYFWLQEVETDGTLREYGPAQWQPQVVVPAANSTNVIVVANGNAAGAVLPAPAQPAPSVQPQSVLGVVGEVVPTPNRAEAPALALIDLRESASAATMAEAVAAESAIKPLPQPDAAFGQPAQAQSQNTGIAAQRNDVVAGHGDYEAIAPLPAAKTQPVLATVRVQTTKPAEVAKPATLFGQPLIWVAGVVLFMLFVLLGSASVVYLQHRRRQR